MTNTVTVFGSSQPLPGEEEYEAAYQLGVLLGKAGLSACTGGYQGIMDAVSKGVAEEGQKAIGVTVDIYNAQPSKYLTEEILCGSLFERIQKLVHFGDAFIVLRGGTGTLLELSIVWELVNKKQLDKIPIAVHGEMWEPLIELMDERMEFEKREKEIIKYFHDIEECAEFIIKTFN